MFPIYAPDYDITKAYYDIDFLIKNALKVYWALGQKQKINKVKELI